MICVENLTVRAGAFCLRDIHFQIPKGSYAVLMGRTGCGKTTLLEALCGLRKIERGSIRLDGFEVTHWDPAERGIGYVPQDRALFHSMTVADNLAFGLHLRRLPASEIERRVRELAQLLGLAPLLQRRPDGLSGGEAQRVALGRALAIEPRILCLDEPLSALDESTRAEMMTLLERLRDQTHVTTLHVTHHPDEPRRLADRLFRLENGAIREESL